MDLELCWTFSYSAWLRTVLPCVHLPRTLLRWPTPSTCYYDCLRSRSYYALVIASLRALLSRCYICRESYSTSYWTVITLFPWLWTLMMLSDDIPSAWFSWTMLWRYGDDVYWCWWCCSSLPFRSTALTLVDVMTWFRCLPVQLLLMYSCSLPFMDYYYYYRTCVLPPIMDFTTTRTCLHADRGLFSS